MAREGKWQVGGQFPDATFVNAGRVCIAKCDGRHHAEHARLIAASPALYEALRNLERAAQAHLDTTDGSEREYLREECFKARTALQSAEPTP